MAKYTAELGLDTESRFLCSVTGRSSGETMNCPAGSAACLIHEGHAYDVGRPQDQLKRHDKDRWLSYLMILLWASQSSGWDKAFTSWRLLLPLIQIQFWGIGRDYFFKCWEDSFFFVDIPLYCHNRTDFFLPSQTPLYKIALLREAKRN